jgi:hypothetical protein
MNARDHQLPDDLAGTAELLREARPVLASDDLDAVRRRVHGRAAARRRPNLAVALCLALGLIFSTAGSGLAISGLSSSGSSVSAQYPDSQPPAVAQPPAPVAPSEAPTPGPTPAPAAGEEPQVLGEQESEPAPTLGGEEPAAKAAPAVAAAQESVVRQVEATGDLPFTGFEAIPVLVAGIALLLVGGLLRRRTQPVA